MKIISVALMLFYNIVFTCIADEIGDYAKIELKYDSEKKMLICTVMNISEDKKIPINYFKGGEDKTKVIPIASFVLETKKGKQIAYGQDEYFNNFGDGFRIPDAFMLNPGEKKTLSFPLNKIYLKKHAGNEDFPEIKLGIKYNIFATINLSTSGNNSISGVIFSNRLNIMNISSHKNKIFDFDIDPKEKTKTGEKESRNIFTPSATPSPSS